MCCLGRRTDKPPRSMPPFPTARTTPGPCTTTVSGRVMRRRAATGRTARPAPMNARAPRRAGRQHDRGTCQAGRGRSGGRWSSRPCAAAARVQRELHEVPLVQPSARGGTRPRPDRARARRQVGRIYSAQPGLTPVSDHRLHRLWRCAH
jgi:hypothetical protein